MRKLTTLALAAALVFGLGGCKAVTDKDPDSAACTYHWVPTAKVPGTVEKGTILIKAFMEPEGFTAVFQGRLIQDDDHSITYVDKDGHTSGTFLELNLVRNTTFPVKYRANKPFTVEVDVTALKNAIRSVRCDIIDNKAAA